MGVSSTNNRIAYSGNGSSTAFSYPYYTAALSDLYVYSFVVATGVATLLTGGGTDYTASGSANAQGLYPSGATITMVAAPVTGTSIVIFRNPSEVQNYSLLQNETISAAALVQQFDYMTLLIQRLQDQVSRAVGVPDGVTATFSPALPSTLALAASAKLFLAVNAASNGLVLTTLPHIISGSGAPSTSVGTSIGDYYIDTATYNLYGPLAAVGGAWTLATSLIGPSGAAGSQILHGSGTPSAGLGVNGDVYLDVTNNILYGPKAAGSWGAGVSLVGPAGATGAAGTNGTNGTNGASSVPTITGTRASPQNIVAGTGIAFTGVDYINMWFVQGNGGAVTVTANPQIAAGSLVGQRLKLIQRSGSNTLTFSDGTGLQLFTGSLVLSDVDKSADFIWDGTNWVLQN